MNRPSRKEIKEAVEKLKAKPSDSAASGENEQKFGKLSSKKSNIRIRKQGV